MQKMMKVSLESGCVNLKVKNLDASKDPRRPELKRQQQNEQTPPIVIEEVTNFKSFLIIPSILATKTQTIGIQRCSSSQRTASRIRFVCFN